MRQFFFHKGDVSVSRASEHTSAREIVQLWSVDRARWHRLYGHEWLAGEGGTVLEAQLIIRPYDVQKVRPSPAAKRYTHSVQVDGNTEAKNVYVAAASDAEYERLTAEMTSARNLRRDAEAQHARSFAAAAKIVTWPGLPERIRSKIAQPASEETCWYYIGGNARFRLIRTRYRNLFEKYRAKPRQSAEPKWNLEPPPYRAIYMAVNGVELPSHIVLRHKCDNRQCVNPNHLVPGTAQDNVDDMMQRGRHVHARRTR